MREVLLCFALLMPLAGADAPRNWQSGKIVRAEQLKRPNPYLEVFYPRLTHRYTIKAKSQLIEATEMVLGDVKWRPPGLDPQPPMSFKIGEKVKFALQDSPQPDKPRELYVLDRKGKEHTLTVDEALVGQDR